MDKQSRIISGTQSIVIAVLTVGIAIVANMIASQVAMPAFDLTENNIYSLSPTSKRAVAELEEPVHAKFFISPDMPPPYHQLQQRVTELLRDYERASGGRFTFEVVIAQPDDKSVEEEAKGLGIRRVAVEKVGEGEVSLRSVYKGVAFVQGSKTKTVADLFTTGSGRYDAFEYEFTKTLLNLSNTKPRVIGIITGLGGPGDYPNFVPSMQQSYQTIYGDLFKVEAVDLSAEGAKVPDSVDALVGINLDGAVPPRAFFAVDQYLQRGGSLGIFQSATGLDAKLAREMMQKLGPNAPIPDVRRPLDFEFGKLLAHYGIKMRQDVVIDRENALATGVVETQAGRAQVSHPANFTMTDLDRTVPFTQNIYAIAMPGPSSIHLRESVLDKAGAKATVVLRSSSQSVRRPDPPQTLQYQQFEEIAPNEKPGPHDIAVVVEGNLPSFYTDQPLPKGVSESDLVKDPKFARIFAVGNAEFFNPGPHVGYSPQLAEIGARFLVSSIEWLAADDSLGQIRSKAQPRLVGEVATSTKERIQYINIVFVPAVFASLGWLIFTLRRRRRDALEARSK